LVELPNLNRQVLHWEEDIGEKKPLSAARKLAKLNPTINITIIPGETPCLTCIFPTVPKREDTFPVFGTTPAFIAALQVAEAIKLLAGFGILLTKLNL